MAAVVISLLFGGADPHTVFNLVDPADPAERPLSRAGERAFAGQEVVPVTELPDFVT
ncbi:hypothetical protein ACTG9Q_18880 [Actinokineospora sp. 24-640]